MSGGSVHGANGGAGPSSAAASSGGIIGRGVSSCGASGGRASPSLLGVCTQGGWRGGEECGVDTHAAAATGASQPLAHEVLAARGRQRLEPVHQPQASSRLHGSACELAWQREVGHALAISMPCIHAGAKHLVLAALRFGEKGSALRQVDNEAHQPHAE